jgi:type II secretory pathway component PulK
MVTRRCRRGVAVVLVVLVLALAGAAVVSAHEGG